MRSVQVDFGSYQAATDINSLLRCIEKCCRFPFALRYIPVSMHDTLIRSIVITLPSDARDIRNKILLARFDAAIIGWSWGRGMTNIRIEYPIV